MQTKCITCSWHSTTYPPSATEEIVPLAKSYERRLIDQLSSEEVADLMNLLAKLRSANNNLVI